MSNTRQATCHYHSKNDCVTNKLATTSRNMSDGFHLIEVLVACSIVIILISVTYRSYVGYITYAKRAEAKLMLFKYAVALERFYFLHSSYQGVTAEILHLPSFIANNTYHIVITNLSSDRYLVKAAPLTSQRERDAGCGVLMLNEEGVRSVSGTNTAETCWR